MARHFRTFLELETALIARPARAHRPGAPCFQIGPATSRLQGGSPSSSQTLSSTRSPGAAARRVLHERLLPPRRRLCVREGGAPGFHLPRAPSCHPNAVRRPRSFTRARYTTPHLQRTPHQFHIHVRLEVFCLLLSQRSPHHERARPPLLPWRFVCLLHRVRERGVYTSKSRV